MNQPDFCITREKHLDHMVKVVPFIVAAYAFQCYVISKFGPSELTGNSLLFLGFCLGSMIGGFITYDLKHSVAFHDDHLIIRFPFFAYERKVAYHEISRIDISDPSQNFGTVRISTKQGKKFGFYFVDDADKIKKWLEEKQNPQSQLAA